MILMTLLMELAKLQRHGTGDQKGEKVENKKSILEQYTDMQREEKDLIRRIQSLNDKIRNIELSGCIVSDSVACGKKGKRPIKMVKVEGFPLMDYEKKKRALKKYKAKLEAMDIELLEKLNEVEDYIESIKDSRIRRIMRYRYIDNLTWQQVARRMGMNHTADGCRMTHDRFIEEK